MRYALLIALLLLTVSSGHGAKATPDPECRWTKSSRADQTVVCPQDRPTTSPKPTRVLSDDILYLSDLLRSADYRFAYNRLFANVEAPPTWVRRYNQERDGVQQPVHRIRHEGRFYQIARVCRPHDTETCLDVVFSMDDGPVAWAFYSANGDGRWIGTPPIGLAEAIEKRLADPNFFN